MSLVICNWTFTRIINI